MIVDGADVFLDTAIRFIEGEESAAGDVKNSLSNAIFALLGAGARSVVAAHHAPKAFETETYITAENVLRGSGELTAAPATVWGIRQLDPTRNRIYIANAKPRDFEPPPPFVIEGRPWIDMQGDFKLIDEPGMALSLAELLPARPRRGRPLDEEKRRRILQVQAWIKEAGPLSYEEIIKRFAAEGIRIAKATAKKYRATAKFAGYRPSPPAALTGDSSLENSSVPKSRERVSDARKVEE
jgi:hypothetical protein